VRILCVRLSGKEEGKGGRGARGRHGRDAGAVRSAHTGLDRSIAARESAVYPPRSVLQSWYAYLRCCTYLDQSLTRNSEGRELDVLSLSLCFYFSPRSVSVCRYICIGVLLLDGSDSDSGLRFDLKMGRELRN
jgi:hypothetical protein